MLLLCTLYQTRSLWALRARLLVGGPSGLLTHTPTANTLSIGQYPTLGQCVSRYPTSEQQWIVCQPGFSVTEEQQESRILGVRMSIFAREMLKNRTIPQVQPNFTMCVSLIRLQSEKYAIIVTFNVLFQIRTFVTNQILWEAGLTCKHRHRRNVMSYRFKSLLKLFSLFQLLSLLLYFRLAGAVGRRSTPVWSSKKIIRICGRRLP